VKVTKTMVKSSFSALEKTCYGPLQKQTQHIYHIFSIMLVDGMY
jgi:hypothetical protein